MMKCKEWKEPEFVYIFPYDFAFYHGIEVYHPWEHSEKHVSFLFNEWKKIEIECQQLFSERKTKQALEPMKEGIALFFTYDFLDSQTTCSVKGMGIMKWIGFPLSLLIWLKD